MAKVWLEDKVTWLFGLAHGDLDEDAIVKGFLKHYVLEGQGIADVQQDLHFHARYRDCDMEYAMSALRRALEDQVDAPPSFFRFHSVPVRGGEGHRPGSPRRGEGPDGLLRPGAG